jgi:SAM-dependent methyltransferase
MVPPPAPFTVPAPDALPLATTLPTLPPAASGAALAAASAAAPGWRGWEQWHRWEPARIAQIVADERQLPPQLSVRRQLAEILVRLGDRLLDVGCGPGALWPRLEPYRPRVEWVGVDVTAAMVAAARRLFPGVAVYQADAGHLPFPDQSFDVVLLRHVLEHLPYSLLEAALAQAMRLARRAVVVDFYLPPARVGPRRTEWVGEGFLETRWLADDVEAPIRRGGWQVRERRTLSGASGESDEVWILAPPPAAGRSGGSGAAGQATRAAGQVPAQETTIGAAAAGQPPKISIVMPTYRRPHTIHRTVQTIRRQTYQHWELIVVDNAGDGGYTFDDPRVRVYVHADVPSASYARNCGLQYVTGDLVCFFDDDDDMFPTYLERFARAFQEHPQAKLARCGMIVSEGQANFTFATPECCLRRPFATPTWSNCGVAHDQVYFRSIISAHGWTEARGDIVVVPEALCRANADPQGGTRNGGF